MKKTTADHLADIERRLALIERPRRKKQKWRTPIGWAAGHKLCDKALKPGAQ